MIKKLADDLDEMAATMSGFQADVNPTWDRLKITAMTDKENTISGWAEMLTEEMSKIPGLFAVTEALGSTLAATSVSNSINNKVTVRANLEKGVVWVWSTWKKDPSNEFEMGDPNMMENITACVKKLLY